MGSSDNGDSEFRQGHGGSLDGMASDFGNGWDPLVSLSQNVHIKGSSMGSHNPIVIPPYDVQYSSYPSLAELEHKLPSFGSGSFSEMGSSFAQIANASCQSDYPSAKKGCLTNSRKVCDQDQFFQDDLGISDEGDDGSSPNGKRRKRVLRNTQFNSIQSMETEQKVCASQETLDNLKDRDEKKQIPKSNSGKNSAKKAKDCSESGEAATEDYIHVRARRGQATNSHSLAERRSLQLLGEKRKISQRMKLLQDLVPGAITGKAVMLDEIINYVQSLQKQVEFLSMKLATVNPDLNIDIDRLLSKDVILRAHAESSAILGFGMGMNTHTQSTQTIQPVDSQLHHVPQVT
ncbi:hypothetical protein GIB67_032597 [Kingdonia uniflora]|uniref:BHLH domain-containing protein n=1 Tax=Kingdonia uniflora TaxID=39325 RepID=A0A7J7NT26_9MAGN|nr:hypothetical protein GIB67_032597 [Kingdonia uniflora]